jgi:hypothetical protein
VQRPFGLEAAFAVEEKRMLYEVEVRCRVYVSAEFGGRDAVQNLVRSHVVSEDWLLQVHEGTAMGPGKFLIKGLSAEIGEARFFKGNGAVAPLEPAEMEEEILY